MHSTPQPKPEDMKRDMSTVIKTQAPLLAVEDVPALLAIAFDTIMNTPAGDEPSKSRNYQLGALTILLHLTLEGARTTTRDIAEAAKIQLRTVHYTMEPLIVHGLVEATAEANTVSNNGKGKMWYYTLSGRLVARAAALRPRKKR